MSKIFLTSPVGRIVSGSLYTANDKDADGKPLVVKSGPNTGQPRISYFFALAIPKGQEPHWAQTVWGQEILKVGAAAFPQAYQSPTFAWKVEDGDSAIPNKKGRKNSETEGYPGNWIVKLSSSFPPKVYREENGAFVQVMERDFVKPGYFVEVAFNVDGNGSTQSPGVYLNHTMVCFRAYGPEIVLGPDVNTVGFGKAALPAGASMTPPASTIPMPQVQQPNNGSFPQIPPVAQGVPQISNVQPRPQFLNPNVNGAGPVGAPTGIPSVSTVPPAQQPLAPYAAVPAAPSAPPAMTSPSKRMTAAAQAPYEVYVQAGWTDQQLIAGGLLMP